MNTGILPPELKSIEQLFTSDARYSVPPYQRSFAWGHDEVEELWEDILAATDRKSEYFLGTIVLQKIGTNEYEIIDGQQRLCCLTMIFSAIRHFFLISKDERSEQIRTSFLGARDYTKDAPIKPKLILNKIDNELFVEHVINSDSLDSVRSALKTRRSKNSNKLLLEAYQYLLENVISESSNLGIHSDGFIVPLINCLRSSLKLIAITVLSGEDANLFFESLNARGKELAISDLVKNRLFVDSGNQLPRTQQLWDSIEANFVRKSIPEYLRHFWIAKRADTKSLIVREKQLYKLISDETKDNQTAAIELLKDLESSAISYVKINDFDLWHDDDVFDKSLEESIKDLQLFRVTQCNPLLLNVINMFTAPKDVAHVFRIVANFSFRYFIIGNQSPGNLERETNKIAVGIRTGVLATSSDIANSFRSINPDSTFKSDFSLAILSKSRSKIARYALAKINNHMAAQVGPHGKEQVVNPDARQVNLEHVLPQSLPQTWQADFSPQTDPADFVYRLGNMTLLTKKVNTNVGDRSFIDKQQQAFNDSGLPINNVFKTLVKWDNTEIEQRQDNMAQLAIEIWRL